MSQNPKKGVLKAICKLKSVASSSTATCTDDVLFAATNGLNSGELALMPSEASLKRTIQRQRQVASDHPKEPRTWTEMVIPETYKSFEDGEMFLWYDSSPSTENNLSFCSAQKQT